MNDITNDDLKDIIENTVIIKDNLKYNPLYDYTELFYSVIGKTPYREGMSISREGTVIVSPQLLFTPNKIDYNLEQLIGDIDEEVVIEARILFFHNYKLQFSEYPVRRFKKDLDKAIEDVVNDYETLTDKTWAVIKTPKSNLWRLSLLHYVSKRFFDKPNNNSGGYNRISNFF